MDTIEVYIDNMFRDFPQDEKTARAKEDLRSMMEDKYRVLKADGKSENEAIGIVISEFGNIEEIADALGIEKNEIPTQKTERRVSQIEAQNYLDTNRTCSSKIAFGVMMCILSPITLIILGGISEVYSVISENAAGAIGIIVLLLFVAVAVPIFIIYGSRLSKYEYLEKEAFILDQNMESELKNHYEPERNHWAIMVAIGVVLCIIALIPMFLIVATIPDDNGQTTVSMILSLALFMLIIAIAVYIFVSSGIKIEAYSILLQMGDYSKKDKSSVLGHFRELYWCLVTSAYLIWSFCTNDWYITWIIWPIAGIVIAVIKVIFQMVEDHKKGF